MIAKVILVSLVGIPDVYCCLIAALILCFSVFLYIQVSGPLVLELDAKQWNEFVHHALR